MKKEVNVSESPYYECPNGCEEASFYQYGNLAVTELLNENGELIEYKYYDFEPRKDSVLRCRLCNEVAIQKIKKVTITTVIE